MKDNIQPTQGVPACGLYGCVVLTALGLGDLSFNISGRFSRTHCIYHGAIFLTCSIVMPAYLPVLNLKIGKLNLMLKTTHHLQLLMYLDSN